MRIGVIGPTGVLGRSLVPMLAKSGHEVICIARSKSYRSSLGETRCADILATNSLTSAVDGLEVVINLATSIPDGRGRGDWEQNDLIRTDGTQNLITALQRSNKHCRLIQQSVAMLHRGDTVQTEGDGLTGSGILASALEMECNTETSDLDWVTIRGGALYGPGTTRDSNFFKQIATGEIATADHPERWISLIHVDDLSAAFAQAVTLPGGRAYIACENNPLTYREMFARLQSINEDFSSNGNELKTLPSFRVSNARLSQHRWQPEYDMSWLNKS